MWGRFAFREIVKPQRLVYINSFSDPKGGVARDGGAPELAAGDAHDDHL